MSDNETQRIIGAIQALSDSHTDQLEKIFDRINDLQTNGCSRGQQHSRAIEDLQQRPEKAIAIVGGALGVITSILAGISWLWSHGK